VHDFESVFDTLKMMSSRDGEANAFKWRRAEILKSRITGVPAHQNPCGLTQGWLFHFKQPSSYQQSDPHCIALTSDLHAKIIQKHRFFYIYKKGRMYQFEVCIWRL